eukprot:2924903-Pyramimonas_sp.AAC.1
MAAAPTVCAHGAPPPGIAPLNGRRVLGGQVLDESHALQYWGEFKLVFCSKCGLTATTDPRHLCRPCVAPTPKGRQNLARIRRGLHPC